uniref:Uncharacterized protein n=1 Tax=Arundo donax TaxID=35708 RepID=A0A0A9HS94_ARUDO
MLEDFFSSLGAKPSAFVILPK